MSCCAERMPVKLCLDPTNHQKHVSNVYYSRLHNDERFHLPQPVVQANGTGLNDAGKKGEKSNISLTGQTLLEELD